ncbi:MAG: hypothetical protein WBE92_17725, partial [Steroidobacteraceae bacterium]
LDAKIREELRRTIRQVQRELGITTVLVTHDQEEAFALADRIGSMNLGRLLEMGRPDDLYARPATRFVATFLGAANLLLARQSSRGLSFGSEPIVVPLTESGSRVRDHEVVAVLRPEEIEVAPSRGALKTAYIAEGVVDEILFSGALERLRVRLGDGAAGAHVVRSDNGADEPYLEVTRTQHEQRLFPLAPGGQVWLGVRRLHVLPTPLSSFTVCAPSEELAGELARHGLLTELAARMKTRITVQVEPSLGTADGEGEGGMSLGGAAVIASRPGAMRSVEWLLQRGAEEVLVLPESAPSPQRVLIHWTDESARRATLAVSASLLRHVSAEAVYIGILPQSGSLGAQRPLGMRALLDARSEAQAVHGLDMRTELRFGDVARELALRLAESPGQLLILGITEAADLERRFAALLDEPRWPLLIVYQPGERTRAPEPARAAADLLRFA